MPDVPRILATSYQATFDTGRTRPAVFLCEDTKGNSVGEYVVKLIGNVETGSAGLLRELVASLLAKNLDLSAPNSAIVAIDPALANEVENASIADSIRRSGGLNFATKNMVGGFVTWPNDKSIPPNLRQSAVETFVFDALIQNPDRRRGKPNVLWRGDELLLIDHEMAFSFLLSIVPSTSPWLLDEQPYLTGTGTGRDRIEHIFFRELRRENIDLDRIAGAIESLTEEPWKDIQQSIPPEWMDRNFQRIQNHITTVQNHLDQFMNEIRRVLS